MFLEIGIQKKTNGWVHSLCIARVSWVVVNTKCEMEKGEGGRRMIVNKTFVKCERKMEFRVTERKYKRLLIGKKDQRFLMFEDRKSLRRIGGFENRN